MIFVRPRAKSVWPPAKLIARCKGVSTVGSVIVGPEYYLHGIPRNYESGLPKADGAGSLEDMLGTQIKLLRKRAGLTQQELAKRAKVSQQLITKLERGHSVETRKLPQIAYALGVSVETLLGGDMGSSEPKQAYHGILLTRAGAMLGSEWEKLDVLERTEVEQDIMTRVARRVRTERGRPTPRDPKHKS